MKLGLEEEKNLELAAKRDWNVYYGKKDLNTDNMEQKPKPWIYSMQGH